MTLHRPWHEIRAILDGPDAKAAGAGPPAVIALDDAKAPEPLPWFGRLLVGAGAWLASLFLAGFGVLLVGTNSKGTGFTLFGALMLGIGVLPLRIRCGDFLHQAGLASSFAGQTLIVTGAGMVSDSAAVGAAVALVLTLALLVAIPSTTHRFMGTVAAAVALVTLLMDLHVPHPLDLAAMPVALAAGVLWVSRPARLAERGHDPAAGSAYGAVVALLGMLLIAALAWTSEGGGRGGGGHRSSGWPVMGHLGAAAMGIAVVALGLVILREVQLREVQLRAVHRPSSPLDPLAAGGLAALALLGQVTPGTPGVVVSVGVLLLAFHRREPILLGLAVLFLVGFLALLYYSLAATLLTKALLLMGTGTALVGASVWLHRRGPDPGADAAAAAAPGAGTGEAE
jgi:hypothetical protein